MANYSFWYGDDAPIGDSGQIVLTFLPSNEQVTSVTLAINPNLLPGELVWKNGVGSFPIPPGTRSIEYSMTFIAGSFNNGLKTFTGNNGEMDDNVLSISRLPLTTNLLVNAGAETGSLAGWYASDGTPPAAAVTAATYFGAGNANGPFTGTYMFYGGATPNAFLTQRVALSSFTGMTSAIDADLLTAAYQFWYADKNGSINSEPASAGAGAVTLTFRDENLAVLRQRTTIPIQGTVLTDGGDAPIYSWVYVTGGFPIPSKTRYIDYTMDFLGKNSINTGVFDDNALAITFR